MFFSKPNKKWLLCNLDRPFKGQDKPVVVDVGIEPVNSIDHLVT
jgi:hypothetical protein